MAKKKKILLVDDSATFLFRERTILAKTRCTLLMARDGKEAVRKALAELPDLILLDLRIPKMDGFEVCQELRRRLETRTTPIIMVTTHREASVIESAYQCGCNDYVFKPFDSRELLAKARSYLGQELS